MTPTSSFATSVSRHAGPLVLTPAPSVKSKQSRWSSHMVPGPGKRMTYSRSQGLRSTTKARLLLSLLFWSDTAIWRGFSKQESLLVVYFFKGFVTKGQLLCWLSFWSIMNLTIPKWLQYLLNKLDHLMEHWDAFAMSKCYTVSKYWLFLSVIFSLGQRTVTSHLNSFVLYSISPHLPHSWEVGSWG